MDIRHDMGSEVAGGHAHFRSVATEESTAGGASSSGINPSEVDLLNAESDELVHEEPVGYYILQMSR
jgi:hypothetical protein